MGRAGTRCTRADSESVLSGVTAGFCRAEVRWLSTTLLLEPPHRDILMLVQSVSLFYNHVDDYPPLPIDSQAGWAFPRDQGVAHTSLLTKLGGFGR